MSSSPDVGDCCILETSGHAACSANSFEELSLAESRTDCCTGAGVYRCTDSPCSETHSSSGSADESCNMSAGAALPLLPSEVIFHICSYLDAGFLVHSFSLICRRFYHIVADVKFWQARLRQRWQKKYPPIPAADGEVDWKVVCVGCEKERRRWSDIVEHIHHYYILASNFVVDSVHVLQQGRLVAAGNRNRDLRIFDTTRLTADSEAGSCCVLDKMNAHSGWIYSMSSLDNVLSTGSWDTHIKLWDLTTQQVVSDIKLRSAVLCTHMERECLIAGGFDGFTYLTDPRTTRVTSRHRYHHGPVLAIAVDDNYIVSVGDDSMLVVRDRRRNSARRIQLGHKALSLSQFGNELWTGGSAGRLSLFDASYGRYSLVEEYDVGHRKHVSGVIRTKFALYTSSFDGDVKVLEPTRRPAVITSLCPRDGEVSRISYEGGVLACGCASGVGVYFPKTLFTA